MLNKIIILLKMDKKIAINKPNNWCHDLYSWIVKEDDMVKSDFAISVTKGICSQYNMRTREHMTTVMCEIPFLY